MTVKANPSRSSVPLTVYRELIKELQASQARIEALNAQNQELVQQNKQLRLAVQTMMGSKPEEPEIMPPITDQVREISAPPPEEKISYSIEVSEKFLPSPSLENSPKSKLSGLVLGMVVFFVVVTFGLGAFWSVRSLVKK